MRLLMMHNTHPHYEAGEMPSLELIESMGRLVEEMTKAGVMLAGVGLRPSSKGVRLSYSGSERRLRHGPYAGPGKLPAGLAIVQVRSIDEAVEWAGRLAGVVGDCEIDVRPVCEPWDLGICPRPAGLETTQFMLVYKSGPQDEAAIAAAGRSAAMARLLREMASAGVFVGAEALQPSSGSLRLSYAGTQRHVVDGPFTEAKELIGGYCMVQVDSIDQALYWSGRFAGVVGDVDVDIRRLYEAPLFAAPAAAA